jgi:hypothetical protein
VSTRARFMALGGSVGAHVFAGLCALAVMPMPETPHPKIEGRPIATVRNQAAIAARPMLAQLARRNLVAHARELRDKGDLRLGAFILAANSIDAAEEGAYFDLDRASELYRERLGDLSRALKRHGPEEAVPDVFSDLSYTGLPGGRMGDTLLTGTGSCEPLSHLVAATLYDAGHHEVRLRYYGGASAGVTHLAPVIDAKDGERDLVAGAASMPGGQTFAADALIDAYARVHGLDAAPGADPPSAKRAVAAAGGGEPGAGAGDAPSAGGLFAGFATATRSMTSGYPSNEDKFAGALPLYAGRAVSAPLAPGEKSDAPPPLPDYGSNCAFLVKPGQLDPVHAIAMTGGDPAEIDLYRAPSDEELDRISTYIAQLEDAKTTAGGTKEQRVVLDACLAALYDRASIEFSLSSQTGVAARAAIEAEAARRDGGDVLASLGLGEDRGASSLRSIAARAGGGAWVMLFLPGGDEAVERLAKTSGSDTFDGVTLFTALLVNASTRGWALGEVDRLPMDRQIEIMHELAHAHDNARPWSAAYELDPPEDARGSAFFRAYQVFLPMSWRLWEAALPVTETLDALERETKEAKLDEATTRALLGYYVRNAIWIYAKRASGGEIMFHIDEWLRGHGYGALVAFDEMKPTPIDIHHIQESLESYAVLHKP